MRYRSLGNTGLHVSELAFGAGPVSSLMVGDDGDRQRAVIDCALARGVNWFDTAAGYGQGRSERNLGRALSELGVAARVHVATKVRLTEDDFDDVYGNVRRSLEGSLDRLRLSRVTLFQLHNSVTSSRNEEPTSVSPADVLGQAGIAEALHRLRDEGLVEHLGLTGIGHATALVEVVKSGAFATIQAPYHLLNPSAGRIVDDDFAETNYGDIIAACEQAGMGVFAIRVLAGGALAGREPSAHTLKTAFFPLPLYLRDRRRALRLQEALGPGVNLSQEAIRFALAHPAIHSAIIGFGETQEIDEALAALNADGAALDWKVAMAAIADTSPTD